MTFQPAEVWHQNTWSDDTPVVSNTKRILQPDVSIPSFGEDVWDLRSMAQPHRRGHLAIHFENAPVQFRVVLKKATWILINDGQPVPITRRGNTTAKRWISVSTLIGRVDDFRSFLSYVAVTTPEVRSLRGIISETMDSFIESFEGRLAHQSLLQYYGSIRLLHRLTAQLGPSDRLAAPSWIDDAAYPSFGARVENATPSIPKDILTPLLLWSTAFVEQFAEDILSARQKVQDYRPSTVQDTRMSLPQTEELALAWKAKQSGPLPRKRLREGGIALSYICFILNWDTHFREGGIKKRLGAFKNLPISTEVNFPIPSPIRGLIHGRPWQPAGIDYYMINRIAADLQAACLILIGLSSAMRPEELLNLETSTVEDDGTVRSATERLVAPDGQVRYLLWGRTFKGQDGVDGRQRPDGVVRSWAITETAAIAVAILEKLNGQSGRLFKPLARGDVDFSSPLTSTTAASNLRAFVRRARELAESLGLPAEYEFPLDTEDFMTIGVLRRTSEVLTQQEINGVLAGAHQAGHRVANPYDTRVTEGYGGTATQTKLGRRTTEQTEQALAMLVADSRTGRIGGPAGDRATELASLASSELGLVDPSNLMTPTHSNDWKRITKSVGQSVYEVPLAGGAHAYCIFHLPWSACTKEGEAPDIAGCKIACPNKALTESSLGGLRNRQRELEDSKQHTTNEERIRADQLIAAYEKQITDSGLSTQSTARDTPE